MSDLVAFISARLGEDEAAARDAYYEGQRWITEEEGVYRYPDDELVHMADRKRDARHIALHDPARVLREVEAKRKILATFAEMDADRDRLTDPVKHAFWTLMRDHVVLPLASVYSDSPGKDRA